MDARLIKEVGANTIRLAHYQHSQDFYNLCDEMGFIVWAEIPFISRMSDTPDAHQNCILQMKELIYQNYNHSSICFWGISNEITIGANTPQLLANLKDLNALAKTLDSSRLTTMAQLSSLPMEDEQNCITDILSYNHYFGWYTGVLEDNEKWLDTFHQSYPSVHWEFQNMAARVLFPITAIHLKQETTAKNIRLFTMNTWQKSLKNAPGCGLRISGICLISAVMPEKKAV